MIRRRTFRRTPLPFGAGFKRYRTRWLLFAAIITVVHLACCGPNLHSLHKFTGCISAWQQARETR